MRFFGLTNVSFFNSNSLNPEINYFGNSKIRVKFDGNFLKQEQGTFTEKQVVNISIAYEIHLWPSTVGQDFTLGNFLNTITTNILTVV